MHTFVLCRNDLPAQASTPAPFTPASDASMPAAARPAPPQAQAPEAGGSAAAALSPRIPAPAQLADDILAADFGPSHVLEGHEAMMKESLALCAPIGEAVQEQLLVLEQVGTLYKSKLCTLLPKVAGARSVCC